MPKFRTLLKNRNFVLYSVGQAFSQFGDRLVHIILIGFVYRRWPGSAFQLAKLFFFTVLPSFFISPIAGVYIDRWNKKYVMIASDVLRALAVLSVPLLFIYRENVAPVYAVIFFIFAAACFFLPARLAVIPALVSRESLLLANSASSITWVVAGIAGFSLGGVIAESIGIKNSLYMNSLVYVFSALSFLLLTLSIRSRGRTVPEKNPLDVREVIRRSFLEDLVEGLKLFFFDRKIRFVMYTFFIFASMVGALFVVGVVFVQETLGSMTKDVGILGMFLFFGLLVGSYAYGKAGKGFSRVRSVFVSILLSGVSIDVFAFALKIIKSFWSGSAAIFFLGFSVAPIYVTANTIVHESIEAKFGGRVFSSMGIIINLGFLSFMFVSSILAEFVDRFWILLACGTGFALFGVISLLTGFLKDAISSSS